LKALEALQARRLSMVSPYTHDIEELEIKYFHDCGYDVLNAKGMNLGIYELDRPSPDEIHEFAKRGFENKAECLLISCLNFRAQPCITSLEEELNRPVVTSAQAVLWNVLEMLGIDESIDGYGRLLHRSKVKR
jgi:maleate isomerase